MMVAMKKSGCCKKKQVQSCHKSDDAEGTYGSNSDGSRHCGADKPGSADKNKCAKQDATCVCICGFQYAAPAQFTLKLHFGIDITQSKPGGYIQHHWKDALLSAPWQPPDVS